MQNPLMHKNPIPSLYAGYPVMDLASCQRKRGGLNNNNNNNQESFSGIHGVALTPLFPGRIEI